jgi:hypothetical protein
MIVLLTEEEYSFLKLFDRTPLTIEVSTYEKPISDGRSGFKWVPHIEAVTKVARNGNDYLLSTDGGVTYMKTSVQI